MADFVLITGDKAMFIPAFGAAVVVVQPGTLTGSGQSNAAGQVVCVDGDESSVVVPGCAYIAGPHVIPGTGTLTIDSLGGDQVATKTSSGGTKVMLKGSTFTAKFQVSSPAQQPQPPAPPKPDSTPEYSGQGSFTTTNVSVKGT